jgi:hypothetical protein
MRTSFASALVCCALLASIASAGTSTVGSPLIDRSLNDASTGVIYLYLGGTQPLAGPGTITQWSFFDNEAGGSGQKVTPLLYEQTAANQWKVVAIGTTRASTGAGVQTNAFTAITGITSLQSGKQYTIGFTHRGYTGTGANVVADGGNSGVVDFTGYGVYTDRWAYALGVANLGTLLGTGGLGLDSAGFGGRIYSASFSINANPSTSVNYCTAGTSTNNCVPSISANGSPSVASSLGYTIHVANVEGAKLGLIFYGISGRAISPWGGGSSFLCVKAPTQRMPLLNSGGTSGLCNGAFSIDWLAYLAATPSALGVPFSAGETIDAQCWYRDPPSAKTTNLSNALEFVTVP